MNLHTKLVCAAIIGTLIVVPMLGILIYAAICWLVGVVQ
jgi:hypothetical protein